MADTVAPVLDEPVLDEEDMAFYERKFADNEARKLIHLFDWVAQERGLDGPSHTLCDRWLVLKRTASMSELDCPDCIARARS